MKVKERKTRNSKDRSCEHDANVILKKGETEGRERMEKDHNFEKI
jgi:hypothetical protein